MPLPVIANVYRCALNWVDAGTSQTAVNVLHVRTATGAPADIAAAFNAHFASDMLDSQPGQVSAQSVDITKLDGTSGAVNFPLASWSSGGSTQEISPATATIVSLATGLRGPANRGRLYLPFTSEAQMENGSLVDGTRGFMQEAWGAFNDALFTNDPVIRIVVASYKHSTAEDVTNITIRSVFGTQRRRQDRLR